jgi:tetratricopeptide (TPR) repeat protein
MEYLDLTRDDPDDFEGKLVSWNGVSYQIGPYLGVGAQKIVYKLMNKGSGLYMHVIKFWRVPHEAELGTKNTVALEGMLSRGFAQTEFKGVIPNSQVVSGHGGTFQIQDYSGAFEDKANETFRLWEKANGLLKASQFEEAAALYAKVLQINPYHTAALTNLAYAQEQLGNIEQSFDLVSKVIHIEPNYFPYQQSYMQIAGNLGYLRVGLEHFEYIKSRFPYQYSLDVFAINLYLMSGNPEKAKVLLEQTLIDPSGRHIRKKLLKKSVLEESERAKLQKEIKAAISAKQQARRIMARAQKIAQSEALEDVLEHMEKAYSIYDKDPYVVMNLAFALSRAKEFDRAGKLLISVSAIVPASLMKVCYANTAFYEIQASRLEGGIALLEATASLLLLENPDQNAIDFYTLPGIAGWIGEEANDEYFLVERPIDSAYELINSAIKQYSKKIPPSVERLAGWYRKAASELNQ